MKLIITSSIILLLTSLSITGCSSTQSQANSPQAQKDNARQAQGELSRETSR